MWRQKIETVLILVPVFQRNYEESEVARKMTGKTQRRHTSVGMNSVGFIEERQRDTTKMNLRNHAAGISVR